MSGPARPFLLANCDAHVGKKLGTSDWVHIDQIQVNVFGELTRWRKPGHCDPETASKGPYGGTIIHGFHMVSLLSHFFESAVFRPEDAAYSLNYGLDKVRILQPVVIGDGLRLRSQVTLLRADRKEAGQRLLKTAHEVEVEGMSGVVMYAEYLSYWFPRQAEG